MGARDVKLGSIMDAASWAKASLFAVLGTPRGSPERKARLDEIAVGVAQARVMADGYQGKLAPELRVAARIAEIGIGRLSRRRSRSPDGGEAADDHARPAKKPHPRRAMVKRR